MKSFLLYRGEATKRPFKYFLFIITCWMLNIGTAVAQYPVKVNVRVTQPVSPYLPQILGELQEKRTGPMTRDITDRLHITLNNTGNVPKRVKLNAKLERLSPTPMSIQLRPGFAPPTPVTMNPRQMIQASREVLNDAFGGFDQSDLIFNNISLADLRQNTMNYKLPEGTYRICISAFDYDKSGMTGPLSAPGTGCATFVICYTASAPQIIMPVTSMLQSFDGFQGFTPHSSQVQFAWTPPASTCGLPLGALTYDLEIHRVFEGQTIKDAMLNPPVFHKQNLHTTTFLLDTMRFPNVLRSGERYAMRVKANFRALPGSPLEIANQGYSQIAGMEYKPVETNKLVKSEEAGAKDEGVATDREYATNRIKGRLLWAFRQSEEDFVREQSPAAGGITASGTRIVDSLTSTSPIRYYLGENGIHSKHASALVQVDPTLMDPLQGLLRSQESNSATGIHISGEEPENYNSETMISSNAATGIQYKDEAVRRELSSTRFPLEGATVQLKRAEVYIETGFPEAERNLQDALKAREEVLFFGGRTKQSWNDLLGEKGIGSGQPLLPTNAKPELPDGGPGLPTGGEHGLPGSGMGLPTSGPGQLPRGPSAPLFNLFSEPYPQVLAPAVKEVVGKRWKVTASATTDAEGRFMFDYIDAEFLANASKGDGLLLTVDKPGFYHFSYMIPSNKIDSLSATDLGDLVMLANTYRFTARVKDIMKLVKGKVTENVKVEVYRKAQTVTKNPFLEQEGNIQEGDLRVRKIVNGTAYVLVAQDSTGNEKEDKLEFNFGKLFINGALHVEVSSAERNLKPLTTDLRVSSSALAERTVVHVTADYEMPFAPPSIEGKVALQSSDNQVNQPIRQAYVQVSYDPEDVLYEVAADDPANLYSNAGTIQNTAAVANNLAGLSNNNRYVEPVVVDISSAMQQSTMFSENGTAMPATLAKQPGSESGFELVPLQLIHQAGNTGYVAAESERGRFYADWMKLMPFTVATDESGYFYVGNLPVLKEGAKFTVKLISVPDAYDRLAVAPVGGKENVEIPEGITPFVNFNLSAEVTPIVGRVVDEQGQGLPFAKLHFKGDDNFFETNGSGAFQTKYFTGTHTLVIEKNGYVTKEGKIHIEEKEVQVDPPLVKDQGKVLPMYSYAKGARLTNENPGAYYNLLANTLSGKSLLNDTGPGLQAGSQNSENNAYSFQYLEPSALESASLSIYRPVSNPIAKIGLYALGIIDVEDIGFLEKKRAKVRFVVKDQDEPGTLLRDVQISLFDTSHVTNGEGEWLYEGLGGEISVTFIPSKGSGYVPVQRTIDLPSGKDWITKEIFLEKGVRLYGTVTTKGYNQPIDSVKITVDGKMFSKTLTDEDGNYEMVVSREESHDIRASKIGYVSGSASEDFGIEAVNLNFQLEDGGGKNINTLLGFEIELDSIEEKSDGSQVWTGQFVNLKPYLPVLNTPQEFTLPFDKVHVNFPDGSNAVPDGDSVITDRGFIPLKLFTYIPLKLENGAAGQIVVKKSVKGDWGSISGSIKFDPGGILGGIGREIFDGFAPEVVPDVLSSNSTPGSIEFFLGEDAKGLPSFGGENEEAIKGWITEHAADLVNDLGPNGVGDVREQLEDAKAQLEDLRFRFQSLVEEYDTVSIELYGFRVELDLRHSSISKSGIYLAGAVHTPEVGPIDSMTIPLQELMVKPSFEIGKLEVDPKHLPDIKIGDVLEAKLSKLVLSENGITTSGIAAVRLPYSETSYLRLDDLQFSTNGITGGKFKFALDGIGKELIDSLKKEARAKGEEIRQTAEGTLKRGIGLFGAAIIKDNGSSLSFGRLSSTNAYYLSGSVDMEFTKWIKKEVEVNNFMLSTGGDFSISVPANYSADFGFASYALNGIDVAYVNSLPYLKLSGKLDIDIPTVSLTASNITFQAQSGGAPEVSVDSIEATIDVPGIDSKALLGILNNGFSGGGSFNLSGTDYGAAINFHYLRNNGDIDLGASFVVGGTIPVGLVTIGSLGGGFSYGKDARTNQYKFSASIKGSASILNLDKAVRLANIDLSVKAGGGMYPVVTGSTDVEVASSLNLASAEVLLDFNRDLFAIDVNVRAEPMKGLASVKLDGTMQISWDKKNPYVFFGTAADISLGGGLLEGNGEFALGVNVKPAVRGNSSLGISNYFRHADLDLLPANSTFSGLYVYGGAKVGSKTEDLFSGDIGIAAAHVRYYSAADATLFLNFADDRYHASLGGELYFYADASVLGINILDAEAGACFRIAGGRSEAKGWYFNGKAAAYFRIGILSAPKTCNKLNFPCASKWGITICSPIPIGARACGYGHASIDYSQTSGLKFGGGIGIPANNSGFSCD